MSSQNVNVARFARNVEWDFLTDFQTPCVFLVRLKVGFGNNEGPSKELINTKTFLLMIFCIIIMRIGFEFGAIKSFQVAFIFSHCLHIILALQIIHHSQALRHHIGQKCHQFIIRVQHRFKTLIGHFHASRCFQNSVDPIYGVNVWYNKRKFSLWNSRNLWCKIWKSQKNVRFELSRFDFFSGLYKIFQSISFAQFDFWRENSNIF